MICPKCHGTGLVPCFIHNWEWPESCDETDVCVWCGGSGFPDDLEATAL